MIKRSLCSCIEEFTKEFYSITIKRIRAIQPKTYRYIEDEQSIEVKIKKAPKGNCNDDISELIDDMCFTIDFITPDKIYASIEVVDGLHMDELESDLKDKGYVDIT